MNSGQPNCGQSNPAESDLSRFRQLVKQNELKENVATQLYEVLSTCEIVLLCDDSDSMSKAIAEEGVDPFAPKRSTRWLELKKLASVIIDFVTAINPDGLDIYFLNRPKLSNVTTTAGLQNAFNIPPNGGTPLIGALKMIYAEKKYLPSDKKLLIVCLTDGEPTDGSRQDLYNVLTSKNSNVHISFAEVTDQEDDMVYLDQFTGVITNFDNTDDYREELNRVKSIQGQQFKFDYTDYVIKILLATFIKQYFFVDQVKINQQSYQTTYPSTQFRPSASQPSYSSYQSPTYSTPTVITSPTASSTSTVSTTPAVTYKYKTTTKTNYKDDSDSGCIVA